MLKVFLATPCYGGQVYARYMQDVLGLKTYCQEKGIGLEVFLLTNDAIVARARNTCVKFFLDSNATHLLFVDADMGFHPKNLQRLLDLDQSVTATIAPCKDFIWDGLDGKTPAMAEASLLHYNVRLVDEKSYLDGFVEAEMIGPAFMLIKRSVFDSLIKLYPELAYEIDTVADGQKLDNKNFYAFFDCLKSVNYLSEGRVFCDRWRAIGGKIFVDRKLPLVHIGNYEFGKQVQQFWLQKLN